MKYLSVCSGIEAASVAWHPLGWKPLAFSEIEPFSRAVLAHHYPDTPLHGDFTVLRDQPWIKDADILVGGTPCQAFSVAGLRNSLADARGNLSLEYVRLADAIDDVRHAAGKPPAIIVWENVPGVLSVKDNAFGCFLAALAGDITPYVPPRGKWTDAGVVAGPQRTVAWRILDAQYFGLAQRRRRVFVVSSAREGFDPATVLLECEGVRRDTPPRREAGEGTAQGAADGAGKRSHWDGDFPHPTLNQSAKGTGGVGASNQEIFSQRGAYLAPVVTARMVAFGEYSDDDTASMLKSRDYKDATDLIAHTLKGEGFDASEDGTGRGTGRGTPLVPVAFAQNTRDEVRLLGGDGQIVGALAAEPGMKQTTYVAVPEAYAFQPRIARNGRGDMGDAAPCVAVADTLGVGSNQTSGFESEVVAASAMAVRRLTPVECERLQGFPDGYTQIPWRKAAAEDCPDGPRYKALGNSMAVPVMRWIGERIAEAVK